MSEQPPAAAPPAEPPPPLTPPPSSDGAHAAAPIRTTRFSWVRELVVSLAAVLLALVVGAILIIVSDPNVLPTFTYFFARPQDALGASWTAVSEAYFALLQGALGGWRPISETLTQASPLICGGLAVSLAFRAGLFNIGAQGQLIVGALCAGWVGFTWHLPIVLHVIVALVAGILGGALWGGIAGYLKARAGAHEVITTIMLNYVGLYMLQWLLTTDVLQRPGRDDSISPVVDGSAQFWQVPGTRLHAGFLVAILAAVAVWWLLSRSTIGFELRAVGANPEAARTAGMSVGRAYTVAMVLAGGLAGLAGVQQVLGTDLPLTDGIAGSVGFDAITVALLGRATPLGTVVAGLLFGALGAGGLQMQLATATPLTLTTVLQATIVLFIAAPALVRAIFRIRAQGAGAGTVLAKGWNA
jgi:general nucleoside transport system permease protein